MIPGHHEICIAVKRNEEQSCINQYAKALTAKPLRADFFKI